MTEKRQGSDAPRPIPAKPGQPRKTTPAKCAAFLADREAGLSREQCGRRSGVGMRTWQTFISEGKGDLAEHRKTPQAAFWAALLAIEEARAASTYRADKPDRGKTDPASTLAHHRRILLASPMPPEEVEALCAAAEASAPGLDALIQASTEQCREHLLPFAVAVYQGNRPWFRVSWHHRLLADWYERLARGHNGRMIVSMPPRHGKTEMMRALMAWCLGRDPDLQVLSGCYSARLAAKTSRAIKRVIGGAEFQRIFPGVRLPDRREIIAGEYVSQAYEWELPGHRGSLMASGLDGGVTGSGGGLVGVDDPCKNRETADSVVYQSSVLERYLDDWCSRSEPPDNRLIQTTRWGENDLPGQLIKRSQEDPDEDQWEVLNLPAILEDESQRHPGDPREIGDCLWPDRYLRSDEYGCEPPMEELQARAYKDLRAKIDQTHGGAALYQGTPRARKGGIIKPEWTQRRWTVAPTGAGEWVISADTKGSSSTKKWAAWTVFQVWFRPAHSLLCYLVDEARGKWGLDVALVKFRELVVKYPLAVTRLIEQKGYGNSMITMLNSEGINCIPVLPERQGDKGVRCESVTPLWASSSVVLPADAVCSWVADWIAEVTRFEARPTDVADRVDAMSQALSRWLVQVLPASYASGGRPRESSGWRQAGGFR